MDLRDEGTKDQEYKKLQHIVKQGFPDTKSILDIDLHPYWEKRSDLAVEDGIVTIGQRLVIPK